MKRIDTLEYRPDIDGLRALAVALVVLFHTDLAFPACKHGRPVLQQLRSRVERQAQ